MILSLGMSLLVCSKEILFIHSELISYILYVPQDLMSRCWDEFCDHLLECPEAPSASEIGNLK